jgi:hypothetical protein
VKRPALALSAGILLVALLPGSTMALAPAEVLDQSNTSVPNSTDAANDLAQTFTAGKTGLLTTVQLYMSYGAQPDGVMITVLIYTTAGGLPTGSILGGRSALPTATADWVTFPLSSPVPVTAGQTYAIVFNTSTDGKAWGSGDTYSGGQALMWSGTAWSANSGAIKDFAFKTYVDPQTTTLQWDKTQVVAGSGTPLTLTETIVFPGYSELQPTDIGAKPNPAAPTPVWTVKSDALSAWFTATGVTCSVQIAVAECTLANVAPGSSLLVTPDGNPITLTLTGTASPALADVGTGTGKAEGCVVYPELVRVGFAVTPALSVTSCVAGQATLAVVAPAATPAPTPAPNATPTPTPTPRPATPPPTAAGGSGSSNGPGSSIWFLAMGLIAAIGGALMLVNRQQRRIR